MYNGTAGVEVFLCLCGVTIVATVVIPNRRVDIGIQLRSFKLRLRSLPESQKVSSPRLDQKASADDTTVTNPEHNMGERE